MAWAALGAAPWLLVTRGPYQFDDLVTPVSDPASQSLGAWGHHLGHTLRPLAKLTFAIEASAGLGGMPWARRVVSIALLAVGAWLLARLLARLGARLDVAIVLAWIWAAHPVQAECVLALAGRPLLLANVLGLGALLAAANRRARRAGVLLALATLSRETSVALALPVGALLLDSPAPLGGRVRAALRTLEPVASVVVVTIAWLLVQPRYRELADYSFHGRPWGTSVIAQIAALPIGQTLYIRPWALTVDHGEALPSAPDALFACGLGLYVAAAIVFVVAWRARRRALAAGAATWLAALAPTQSIVPKLDALTERPLSLALAALLVVAVGARPLRRAWGVSRGRRGGSAPVFAMVVVALLASAATYERGSLYSSEEALWRDAASKSVANARPHYNLAKVLEEQGRYAAALVEARAAARIDPYDGHAAALAEILRAREHPDLQSPR